MFAKVRGVESIRIPLNYNNRKVLEGKAEVIHAANFIKDAKELNKRDMVARFDQRISLNERTLKPAVHIPIAFKRTDELSNDKMKLLADRYMEAIGLGEQPYLVYRHYDVMQTHMHIVSTNIREDGSRIELRDIIFWKSRQVANALADEFSLARAERADLSKKQLFEVKQATVVDYGKTDTQRAISDVLNTVIGNYRFDSMGALNAGLRVYQVAAVTGKETSFLYKRGGILFQAMDEKGRRVGSPIKASRFFLNPTKKNLEIKFSENRKLMEGGGQRIVMAVDWELTGTAKSWDKFRQAMEKEGISLVVQRGKKEGPEELYFVDHRDKVIFSGESLGSQYGLAALQQRFVQGAVEEDIATQRHRLRPRL